MLHRAAGGGAPATTASAAADASAYPVTITHAHGTTTINKAPSRIATIGWADADVVAALGVLPVGAPKITWGGNDRGSTDWFDAEVAKLGAKDGDIARYDDSAGIPFDAIAATSPDLILGLSSGVSKEEYDKLTKIAPVVAYTDKPWGTPWQEQLAVIGTALGKAGAGRPAQGGDREDPRRRHRRQPGDQGQERGVGVVQPHRPVDHRALHDVRPAPADAARVRPRRLPDCRGDEQGHERVLGQPLGGEGLDPRRRPRGLLRREGVRAPSRSPATRSSAGSQHW